MRSPGCCRGQGAPHAKVIQVQLTQSPCWSLSKSPRCPMQGHRAGAKDHAGGSSYFGAGGAGCRAQLRAGIGARLSARVLQQGGLLEGPAAALAVWGECWFS